MYRTRVSPGKGRGEKLGFPTLNFKVPPGFTEPYGIYAGWVWLGAKKHKAAFHWGPVPVFDIKTPSLEAHLLHAHLANLPSEPISFEFVTFLRDVASFPSPEALASQIRKDVEKAETLL